MLPLLLCLAAPLIAAKCADPSPAFPVPSWTDGAKGLATAFQCIENKLAELVSRDEHSTCSFSVEVTSATETLWSAFHTSRKFNTSRPGDRNVDGRSLYRIASCTKTFTVLGILYQHAAGNLSLDDPVSHYLPELAGEIPWDDITLRILALQLSGIPREYAQSDILNVRPDPLALGLPPASRDGLPTCYEYDGFCRPCNRTDMLNRVKKLEPLFAPNQKSTYSNLNYLLLGLVLEEVTGMSYSEYIQTAILGPLDMSHSSLEKPSDAHAVLPLYPGGNYWDWEQGVARPSGGIYSCSEDLSKYLRYVLTHYNAIATGVNWLMPASWATGMQTFYGMPWEIFRTDAILEESDRPVTFVTKGGGLPGYYSQINVMPEYGFGLTVLVGGDQPGTKLQKEIVEAVTVPLIQAAEAAVWKDVEKTVAGTYVATTAGLNTTLSLAASPLKGLEVVEFISNGTDVLSTGIMSGLGPVDPEHEPWHAQLVPTLLYKDEKTQRGEVWRMLAVPEKVGEEGKSKKWNNFFSTDVDTTSYAGLPVNEIVFWHEEGEVDLPAWRVKLKAQKTVSEDATSRAHDELKREL